MPQNSGRAASHTRRTHGILQTYRNCSRGHLGDQRINRLVAVAGKTGGEMNPSLRNRINDSKTFCVVASTHRLVPDTIEQKQVHKMNAVDIEREVGARERMKLMRRMAV